MENNEIDHLTHLYTRAAFDRVLEQAFQDASIENPQSLIFLDLDHFKRVNDNHGHQMGDEILRQVADKLQDVTRRKGSCYRYGGEEFAVLLHNHTIEEAFAVGERARIGIELMETSIGSVTASFGIATAPLHASTAAELLEMADEAVYDAKTLGRNLVRHFGEPPPEHEKPKKPARKQEKPGTLSDEQKEALRIEYLRNHYVKCPIDQIRLEVNDVTHMGEKGKSFLVRCPGCGFSSNLPGPK